MIDFYIPGKAQTKGSGKAVGRGRFSVVVNDNPKEKGWAETVAWCAKLAMKGAAPLAGPVTLYLHFDVARPASHFGVKGLLPSRPARPTTKPDLDKTTRSVVDALTGIVYRDDSQVVRIVAEKRYTSDGSSGVHVSVGEWVATEMGRNGRQPNRACECSVPLPDGTPSNPKVPGRHACARCLELEGGNGCGRRNAPSPGREP